MWSKLWRKFHPYQRLAFTCPNPHGNKGPTVQVSTLDQVSSSPSLGSLVIANPFSRLLKPGPIWHSFQAVKNEDWMQIMLLETCSIIHGEIHEI